MLWNDLISESQNYVGFSEHCEVQFWSRLLALDVEVKNMDMIRIWSVLERISIL
jgi:hypothetical protein